MKKIIAIAVSIVIIICVSVFVFHYYSDNIYGAFAFNDTDVIEVDDNVYRCPKDNPDAFIDYMKDNGWTENENEQMGAMLVFDKGDKKAFCVRSIDYFYTEYTVEYSDNA